MSIFKKCFFLLLLCFIFNAHASTMDRPKIGLVLSGGGAKGFAHIGTLKMLDSLHIPVDFIAMKFWRQNVDKILEFNDKKILEGKGGINNAQMEVKVREIYQHFDNRCKAIEANLAGIQDIEELENELKKKKK